MKPTSTDNREHKTDKDLNEFEELPEQQKELQKLKDLSEKSDGPEKKEVDQEIRRQAEVEDT